MSIKKTTLKNGLTVIGDLDPSAASCAFGYFVGAGSRDEQPKIAGISHFLEHMVFKGTKNRSALELTYEMASYGAQANAFTSMENTVFYASILPEYLSSAVNIF